MRLKRINNFSLNEQSSVELEIQNIDKEISKADLAISYLKDRVNKKEIPQSESLRQQAMELQKKVAALQKKSVAVKKLEDLEKQKTKK
jgi:hypothetical protein